MTREEAIRELKIFSGTTKTRLSANFWKALEMAIKALEQMPSDDEVTITMKRGTLKCSNQGYIVYNKDWFRKHFAAEIKIITGYDGYSKQPTSDDCVSRQAVLEKINDWWGITSTSGEPTLCDYIRDLPPVTPTRKKGKWIVEDSGNYNGKYSTCYCSNCKDYYTRAWREMKYCPNCGAEMESE